MSCPICGREYGGNPACECFEEMENLRATVRAMTETAAEQSRVHVEMHGDLVVQDELILKLGGRIKELEQALKIALAWADRDWVGYESVTKALKG